MKLKKRLLCITLSLAMAGSMLALSGCSNGGGEQSANTSAPASGTAPASSDITVGISVATATNNPHIVMVVDSLVAAVEAQGWTPVLQDADGDSSKQSTQFDNLVTQGVDLIIYWANDADAAVADAKKADDAGIPVISYFADVCEEAQQYVEAYVGADQYDVASAVADHLHEVMGGSGQIAIINGKEGKTDFVLRSEGFRDELAKLGDYEIIAEEYCDSDRTNCQGIMENFLTAYPDLDAVFTCSDDFGLGAYNALSAAGKAGEITQVSIDGLADVISLISSGEWESTVYQTPQMMADKCISVATEVLDGTFSGDYEQFTDYYMVTADNAAEYME